MEYFGATHVPGIDEGAWDEAVTITGAVLTFMGI